MSIPLNRQHYYCFRCFRLDPTRRLLYRNDEIVLLAPKAIELLAVLVDHPKVVLTKEELIRAVWPDTYIEESNLAHNISALRKALEETGSPALIETIAKRGYRFTGDVQKIDEAEQSTYTSEVTQQAVRQPRRLISRWHLVVGVALIAVISAVTAAKNNFWASVFGRPKQIESLAVLPLENLSDSAQDYFAEGMTEALIIDLSKMSTLRVVPRSAVRKYKEERKAPADIARELKVEALVEGSVLRSGPTVRITAQLIDASTGRNLWAESYERQVYDVVNLQREIAYAIATEIGAKARAQPLKAPTRAHVDPDAYDLYLRGKSLSNRRVRPENQAAIALLEQSVGKDRAFAPAHASLALAYIERFFTFAPAEQPQLVGKTRAAIETALSLDANLSDAYLARGRLLWSPIHAFAHESAIQDFRRAIDLNPRSVQAHWWLSAVYGHTGLLDEGFREAQTATELNPSGALPPYHLVEPILWQGKYERALEYLRSSPGEGQTSLTAAKIVWALFQLGRKEEAAASVEQFLKDFPDDFGSQLTALQALFLADAGDEQRAERKIAQAMQGQGAGPFHHTAFFIACAFAKMNKPRQVVQWLERAAASGFPCYPLFERDPSLDPVRNHPQVLEFMAKLKKEWEVRKAKFS